MTRWALYVGCVKYSTHGISLHKTCREALESVADVVELSSTQTARLQTDELWEVLRERADGRDIDWTLEEVEVPQ